MQTQPSLSSQLSARERGLTTAILGLGLITFALDASNTTLILPQVMTNLRVEVYQIHWVLTAPGISSLQHTLQWSGEIAALIPTKTMALIRDRLFAEASTAAWQDFFGFNAMVAIFCLFPALPFWRRRKYQAPSTLPAAAGSAQSTGASKVDPKS